MDNKEAEKTLEVFIDEASELLSKHPNVEEVVIKTKKTTIRVNKEAKKEKEDNV